MTDVELLHHYVANQSEQAFAELLERHINMVYSAALRIVREPAIAEDVTQAVFIQLAKKAGTIRSVDSLAGWLYRVTHGQSANVVRAEHARRQREKEAMSLAESEQNTLVEWEAIAPHLEEAMGSLGDIDQDAVVMRFFEGRNWREVAAALAMSEDAVQKRVKRALDKLRSHFLRRGITVSLVTITSLITANAVHATPPGLAASVLAECPPGTITIVGSLKALLAKKTALALFASVFAVMVAFPFVVLRESQDFPNDIRLRKGLVLHFTFDEMAPGGQATDTSGAQNNGQVIGATWTPNGHRGGAYHFRPPHQYIRVPNSSSLNPPHVSLAVWIKTSRKDGIWHRIFDKSWTNGYALSIGGGFTPGNDYNGKAVIEMAMLNNQQKGIANSDLSVTDDQWHHVATTFDGREERLYVDGVVQKSVASWHGNIPRNTFDLTIGLNCVDPNADYGEIDNSFDGLIDEPMIWERSLSDAEVAFLYNSQR